MTAEQARIVYAALFALTCVTALVMYGSVIKYGRKAIDRTVDAMVKEHTPKASEPGLS